MLVHAASENKRLHFGAWTDTLALDDFPSVILKETRKTIKDSGVNTLCLAEVFLEHTTGASIQKSPVLLTPVIFRVDKVRKTLHFERIEDATFVNPYIAFLLESHDVRTNWDVTTIHSVLTEAGFTVHAEATPCLGNFHHHRYAVLRELESLLEQTAFSQPLSSLLGDPNTEDGTLVLPKDLLFAADVDHLNVFDQMGNGNIVIQGPPGTGKSQVLANTIGKLLAAEKSSIVLSEKRVALEVLLQKLQSFGLHRLGFVVTSDAASKELLQQLEENWNYFEQNEFPKEPNLRLSEQYLDQLQFSLDLLNQPDTVGGISLYDFREWMPPTENLNVPYMGVPPTVPALKKHASTLKKVYAKGLSKAIAALHPKQLQSEHGNAFTSIEQCLVSLKALHQTVPFTTWADFHFVVKQAVLCQNRENHQDKQYTDLYKPNSRKQKRFFKLYRDWNRLQKQMTAFVPTFAWIQQPDAEAIAVLKSMLAPSEAGSIAFQSYFSRRKFQRHWKKYSSLPLNIAKEAIAEYDKHLQLQHDKSQLIIDFCDLGVLDPEKEIDILFHSIQNFVQSEWEILADLTPRQVAFLTESHHVLNELNSTLKQWLQLQDDTPVLPTLQLVITHFGAINALQPEIVLLDTSLLKLIGIAANFEQCEAIVAHSHWSNFQKRFPTFSAFSMDDLHAKVSRILSTQAQESKLFAHSILAAIQERFRRYQTLLNTPAKQLNEEEKCLKKRLRKGKSLLVKEFAKTRSHPSVRELFASEAREWIQLLIPIWLSNPTQVSKNFPLEQHLFDVVIFDEASQIPLQNGLGALQRSRMGIIAGDNQQMGPTSYFRSGASEIVDLLHQASFQWNSCGLKHHYRSLHPELIRFSNKHFYQNELKAYPAFGLEAPVHHHFVENGVFENRRNVLEAKAVAEEVKRYLNGKNLDQHLQYHLNQKTDTIGIVAFSEEQLQCIRQQLDPTSEQALSARIEAGTAFFKSLENVQGDECDCLFISFGYGRDSEGSFAMRFGPMNTENGRRRLNVLLTRARKRMDFFTSVAFADFKLSDNESIDLLRQWFANVEAMTSSSEALPLPFNADYSTQENILILRKPQDHFSKAEAFVTFQSVMENRGWQLKYQ